MKSGAHRKMQVIDNDHGNLPATIIGVLLGIAGPWAALVPSLPGWFVQSAATVISGVFLFAANKLIGKWIDQRWPDRKKRRAGDTDE